MRLRRRSLVLLATLAACTSDGGGGGSESSDDDAPTSTAAADLDVVAGESDDATLGPPHVGDLTLDLPADCTVPIEESVISFSGREYDITHDLTFTTDADGAVVTRENPDVTRVDIGGIELEGGEGDLVLARLPSVVVDEDGQVIDLVGLDELMAEANPASDVVLPAIEARYVSDAVDKSWNTWIGAWAYWGAIVETTEERVMDDGTAAPLTFTFTSVGTTGRGLAVLRATADIDQDRLGAVAGELPPGSLEGVEVDGSIVTEVVTDPATLRPESAVYEHEVTLTQDGQVVENVERRAVRFDWAAGDCE